jgi:type VI secretion system protein ImpA
MSSRDALALPDLRDDAPAGANLELDPDFSALERAVQGKPETPQGDPATPPDWKEAESLADGLLQRTRDLRILTHLAAARLHRAGLPAFADVLTQIRDQLEARWDQVHPQLDPEDNRDPTWRKNALSGLQDPGSVLRALRDLPVASARDRGTVLWRDIAVFQGQLPADPGRQKLTEVAIRSVFAATDADRLATLRDAVGRALREARSIPAAFEAHAGRGAGPDFAPLQKLLQEMEQGMQRFEVVKPDEPAAEEPADAAAAEPVAAASARGGVNLRSISAVSRREDALYLLDLAAAYFRANEPSSPLPILIDRARRLATMEFLDILRDIAPDGLGQAQIIAGPPPAD